MRILYFTIPQPDYLADSFFIGLQSQPGITVYQSSIKEVLYKSYPFENSVYGKGFTLYRLLDGSTALAADLSDPKKYASFFDLVIFSSIHRQYKDFKKHYRAFGETPIWILDGEDTPAPYPYHGEFWRNPRLWFLPKAHKRFLYFKREWTPVTISYMHFHLIHKLRAADVYPKNFRRISFSIPKAKIINEIPQKTKLFPVHVIDEEIAKSFHDSTTTYAFDNEEAYYNDLRQSKYGITTKRGGWDCLRHYEIAANGAVICFRDLDQKAGTCAPHDLKDGINCISYSSYEELKKKIDLIDDAEYTKLQTESIAWVQKYSCENLVARTLSKELKSGITQQITNRFKTVTDSLLNH